MKLCMFGQQKLEKVVVAKLPKSVSKAKPAKQLVALHDKDLELKHTKTQKRSNDVIIHIATLIL